MDKEKILTDYVEQMMDLATLRRDCADSCLLNQYVADSDTTGVIRDNTTKKALKKKKEWIKLKKEYDAVQYKKNELLEEYTKENYEGAYAWWKKEYAFYYREKNSTDEHLRKEFDELYCHYV